MIGEHHIVFLWLIQSHAKFRPTSAYLREYSHGARPLLFLQKIFDHACGLFCNCKHIFPPSEPILSYLTYEELFADHLIISITFYSQSVYCFPFTSIMSEGDLRENKEAPFP
jgi:hypothetical protein